MEQFPKPSKEQPSTPKQPFKDAFTEALLSDAAETPEEIKKTDGKIAKETKETTDSSESNIKIKSPLSAEGGKISDEEREARKKLDKQKTAKKKPSKIKKEQEKDEWLSQKETPPKISELQKEARAARKSLAKAEKESQRYGIMRGIFKKEELTAAKEQLDKAKERHDKAQNELLTRYLEKAKQRWPEKEEEEKFEAFKNELIFKGILGREQERLTQAKQEILPEKDQSRLKEILGKASAKYTKLPKGYRWAISAGLGTAVAFGAGSVAGAAIISYAGFRFGRAALGSLSAAGAKGIGDALEKLWLKNWGGKEKREEKVKKSLIEQAESLNNFEQLNKLLIEKREERSRELAKLNKAQTHWRIGKMAAMIGAGGGIAFCAGHFDIFGGPKIAEAVEQKLKIAEGAKIVKEPLQTPEDLSVYRAEAGLPPEVEEIPPSAEPELPEAPEVPPETTIGATETAKEITEPYGTSIGIPEKGVTADFTLELGKAGVPSQPERVLHMISLNHMKEITNPLSGMFTEEQGAKSLNMAANLVRLTEGKNVIGIDADEFSKIVRLDFEKGILEIKDHAQFNQILDKLENHSEELWQKGILQKGAAAYLNDIKPETWEKIIHAEGLDKVGDIETGIEGHDTVTAEHIANFEESEMVKDAEVTLKAAEFEKTLPQEEIERIAETGIDKTIPTEKDYPITEETLEEFTGKPAPMDIERFIAEKINQLTEKLGFTQAEYGAIDDIKVGKFLEQTPESESEIWEIQRGAGGGRVDLPHEGVYRPDEIRKHIKLAKLIREQLPNPSNPAESVKQMTINEFLRVLTAGEK